MVRITLLCERPDLPLHVLKSRITASTLVNYALLWPGFLYL